MLSSRNSRAMHAAPSHAELDRLRPIKTFERFLSSYSMIASREQAAGGDKRPVGCRSRCGQRFLSLDAANGVSPRSRTHFPRTAPCPLPADGGHSLPRETQGTLFDQRDIYCYYIIISAEMCQAKIRKPVSISARVLRPFE